MDANELGRWTRFAAKGGIGKCTAMQDCVAEEAEDLMFMKDDDIIVLMQLPGQEDMYLGYCEGVVGRFHGTDVRFHTRLKKPVMTKRSSRSLSRSSSRPSSSQGSAAPPIATRETFSALSQRVSPSLPPAPSRMSYSYSTTSVSVAEDTSTASTLSSPHSQYTSPPLLSSPHIPASLPVSEEAPHLRSASHSSGSTAIESAPRTPADFGKDEPSSLIRIVSLSRQVDSPTSLNEDGSLRHEESVEFPSKYEPELRRNSSERTVSGRHSLSQSPRPSPLKNNSLEETAEEDQASSSLDTDDSGSRVSVALSDGEVGIGLSLLQDFMGGDGDDTLSMHSDRSDVRTPELRPAESAIQPDPAEQELTGELPRHSMRNSVAVSERSSVYSMGSHRSGRRSQGLEEPHPPFAASLRSTPSRSSLQPSISDSEYGGEEWEGASDIYDNYRYSRYSVASKASRFSKGSMHTVASGLGLEPPPPVPVDGHRPSLESLRQGGGRERLASVTTSSSSVEDVRVVGSSQPSSPALSSPREGAEPRRVPPPLELMSSHHKQQRSIATTSPESTSSPLLHGTFDSPMSSPNQHSPAFLSPLSPPLTTPLYSNTPGGAASALRHRLEQDRLEQQNSNQSTIPSRTDVSIARQSTMPIVVDDPDDESHYEREPRSPVSTASQSQSPPSSPSVVSEKKRMIETTYYVANQAPPPPYTPMSPVAGTSSEAMLHPQEQPQPQSQSQPRPPLHVEVQPEPQMPQPTPRPVNPERQNNAFVRRSLFMPHPHAPKPAETPSGPMYGRQPYNTMHQAPVGPIPGSLMHTIHMALAARGDPMRPRIVTIYGRFEHDLGSAIGPVPISFTLEPPNNIPANRYRSTVTPTPMSPVNNRSLSMQQADTISRSMSPPESSPGKVIPRANFFPKAQTPRPRSQSFSGFESPTAEVFIPEEPGPQQAGQPIQIPTLNSLAKRSKSAHVPSSSPSPQPPPSSNTSTASASTRAVHRPSPLSLSKNIVVASSTPATSMPGQTSPRVPQSPLSRPPISAPPPSSPPSSPKVTELKIPSPNLSLGQASSAMTSPTTPSPTLPPEPPTARPVLRKISGSSSGQFAVGSSAPASPTKSATRVLRHSRSSTLSNRPSGSGARPPSPQSRSSMQGRRSGETDTSHMSDARSGVISPTQFSARISSSNQTSSLRSKLSMPTLKIRSSSDRPSFHEERSPTLSSTPSDHLDQPTVSVQDMNFELVKPTGQLASISEDMLLSPTLPSPSLRDAASLRAESPALSVLSGSSMRTGITQPPAESAKRPTPSMSLQPKPADLHEVEAHRQRELRWISMMASVPASQGRKNKKVRKLLWEGVPASVRYLVWAHLTDSKAKRMEGLYAKLVKRERVPASASIERDVHRVFVDEPPLLDGSLVNLLQAYLSMVPDVQYSRGLTVVAGHLLLHSPEEDAFWTFVSLMDSHLRPYFSAHPVQMEVDASLFGKAVEALEPTLAKKLFIDMAIPPASLCRPWFTALFMEALPSEHAQRVWDIFLFEGVVFLFRVGLAIVQCCKQTVMKTPERDAVLNILLHPPALCLPANSEAFLEIAASVKLKDDDIRKQRTKLEARVKRQTQARAHSTQVITNGAPPSISLPRS